MEVKVQIQMIRGPGRQDSWMTEKERKKGRKEGRKTKVDTWMIGSPGIYSRLWQWFQKIQEQWNAEIFCPAVLVKEELPQNNYDGSRKK